jgi:dTMP kinase
MSSESHNERGRLVTIDGIDGAGKTTLLDALEKWLIKNGVRVLRTQQPTSFYRSTPQVRKYLDEGDDSSGMTALALLAAADRLFQQNDIILPALADGIWVLCDRYVYSTYAFFGIRGVDGHFLRKINSEVIRPDLPAVLHLSPQVALSRIAVRDGRLTKYEERHRELFCNVATRFRELAISDNLYSLDFNEYDPEEVLEKLKAKCFALL